MYVARRARWALVAGILGSVSLACGAPKSASAPSPERSDRYATNAVGVVGEDDIGRQRVTRVEELIRGRVAGVEVLQLPNGDYQVRIRGINSFYGSTEPLFVLDGVPLISGNSLRGVNPSDVARIEVLKDAGATAGYGLKGANGVILITTKRSND